LTGFVFSEADGGEGSVCPRIFPQHAIPAKQQIELRKQTCRTEDNRLVECIPFLRQSRLFFKPRFGRFSSENRDYVFDGNDVELIVGLEINRNCIFGMKQYFVVLT